MKIDRMALLSKVRESYPLIGISGVLFLGMLAFQNCSPGFQLKTDLSSEQSAATPVIDLSAISDLTNATDVTLPFKITGVPASMILETRCQLDKLPEAACPASSVTYSAMADGDHTFKVTVRTPQGVTATAMRAFRKDGTKPVTNVASAPSLITNQVTTSFVFTSTDNLSGVAKIQ